MGSERGSQRANKAKPMSVGAPAAVPSDADIQRIVWRLLGQTTEARKFERAAIRIAARYRKLPARALRQRKKPKAAGAKAQRRWLEGVERRAFQLARDIDRIQHNGPLSAAFEALRDLPDGRLPGFPDTGLVLTMDLDEQFLSALVLGFASRTVRQHWAPPRGAPRMIWRDSVLQELAHEFEQVFGAKPSVRTRDPFSRVARIVLLSVGFPEVDTRDAVRAALTGPSRAVGRIYFLVEPKLREIPEIQRARGRK